MSTAKRVTPGREGYKILFNTNTVIMNNKFAAAAAKYGTAENKLMKEIRTDFPGMAEVVVSGRERPSAKSNSRLTYANMEEYISVQDNADELMAYFIMVQKESKKENSPYAYVRNWFVEQFPDYQECKVFKREKIISFADTAPQENEEKVS